jgi:repressor LexA
MDGMSTKQRAIYSFIQDYIQEHGRPPTNREIGAAVGIESTGHVDYHLGVLEKKGYIERESHTSRGIRLTHQGLEVKGRIAAGKQLDIFDVPDKYVDVTRPAFTGKRYLLEVRGKSMIDECIDDGDYVLIEEDAAIEPGDVIVACQRVADSSERGAATLKRFFKGKDEKGRDRVELRPANSEMKPIFVDAEEWDREWEVQGKVRAVYRLFERPRR